MIKVISFDIGGTLIQNESDDKYNLKSLSEMIKLPYDIVRDSYKSIFQKKKGTLENLVNNFCDSLNIQNTQEIENFFSEKFSNVQNTIPNKYIKLIRKLKNKGYKVILFSNSCCLINNYINEELYNMLDGIYYSFDMGYTKSDEESYRLIEKELRNLPHEFLHIGDTLKSDYLIPKKNGWNALYYGKCDNENINSITDLEKIEDYL